MINLKAAEHMCEEASTLSTSFYIPCNRPAVAIVGWKGRTDTPMRMCAMCEDHNLRNRGGYRVEAYAPPVAKPIPKTLKPGMKRPVCAKCGRKLNGQVPEDATGIVCYLCDNPPTKPRTARDRK